MLAGLTPFVMGLSAVVSILKLPVPCLPSLFLCMPAFWREALFSGAFTDRTVQSWAGVFLLAGDGAIRVIDSALTFTQRGLFFLGIGLAAAVICYFMYLPSKKKTPVHRDKEEQGEEGSR